MVTNAIMDSSVIVALVTIEKYSDWSNSALPNHQYLHALDLSFYEVANSIRYKVSEKFNSKDAAAALRQAEKIMNLSTIHCFSEVLPEAFTKALELKIAVYNAAFLSLAEKLDAKLLTLDLKLVKKLEGTKYFSLMEYPTKNLMQHEDKFM